MNFEEAIKHLKQDAALASIIAQVEAPAANSNKDVYLALLNSIISQQLSGKVATVIFNRFCQLFPDNYPSPDLLEQTDISSLRSVGLSNQKATYLKNVATFTLEHTLNEIDWNTYSDEAAIAFLTQIKGVGKWTVEMILMFVLNRPDILPLDDLGIQQAFIRLYNLEETGKSLKNKMIELAEPWRPYRTLASRYLWRYKDAGL